MFCAKKVTKLPDLTGIFHPKNSIFASELRVDTYVPMSYSECEHNLSDLRINVAYVKTQRGAPELEYALLELLEQEQV